MQVSPNPPSARRDLRLDLFRGLANWAIFLDHIPHEVLSAVTTRNYGFSDAADLFVFISGYTAAFVFGRVMIERGYLAAASRLMKRALQLYAAHILLVGVYIAVIASVSRELQDPNDLNVFNVAAFIRKPLSEFAQALALRYRPVNLDVLPLYILLLATFALGVWPTVRKPTLVLLCSIALYLTARHFGWNLATSRSAVWYFNPFAWQLLFFLGAWVALGPAQAVQSIVRTRSVFWLAIAYLVFALVVTIGIDLPHLGNYLPSWMVAPFAPNDKTNLAPYRIVHLIALAIVVTRFLAQDSPLLKWRSLTPLIKCGQNSLPVFCTGIVLSFCAHAAIEANLNSLWVQIFAGVMGLVLMTAVAYYQTWLKRLGRIFTL
jgi:hypothetical protein